MNFRAIRANSYQEEAEWLRLLPGTSRTYRAKGGDLGARYTRWTLPPELAYKRGDDWHGYTGTEIAIVRSGRWSPTALVALTARLCDQAVAWDDQTRLPAPLHLGIIADQDHPEYRATDDELYGHGKHE